MLLIRLQFIKSHAAHGALRTLSSCTNALFCVLNSFIKSHAAQGALRALSSCTNALFCVLNFFIK